MAQREWLRLPTVGMLGDDSGTWVAICLGPGASLALG